LAHQIGLLTTQDHPGASQMRLDFIERCLYLPRSWRIASWFSQRQMVLSLMVATRPQFLGIATQIRYAPTRQRLLIGAGQFTGQGFDLNDQLWGKNPGAIRAKPFFIPATASYDRWFKVFLERRLLFRKACICSGLSRF